MTAYVSSDSSKLRADCCLLVPGCKPRYQKFKNEAQGYTQVLAWARHHAPGMELHFCMEATGCYHLGLAIYLAEQGVRVSVVNPRRIKHFAIAMNLKNKNDKVDSLCIARYAEKMGPREWSLKDPARRELDAMRARLRQLGTDIHREESRLENKHLPPLAQAQIHAHVEFLKEQVQQVQARVREVMSGCESAREVYEAVTQINGVGPEVGLLLSSLDIQAFESAKALPVFFGLNPRQHQSGKLAGQTRMSKAGDATGRATLMAAANAAVRSNPVLKEFAENLMGRGLRKKQALVAVARKLLMIAWAIARNALEGKPIIYPGGPKPSRLAKKYCDTPKSRLPALT